MIARTGSKNEFRSCLLLISSNACADHDLAVQAGRNADLLAVFEDSRQTRAGASHSTNVNLLGGLALRQIVYGTARTRRTASRR